MSPELSSAALQFAFTCPLASGMHARPASLLAEVSNTFRSDVVLTNLRTERQANTKSVLSIIAADVRKGDRCFIHVSGVDERAAHAAIRSFVEGILPTCDVPLAGAPIHKQDGLPRVLQKAGVRCYFGSPASPGMARGAVIVVNSVTLPPGMDEYSSADPNEELVRVEGAIKVVRDRIQRRIHESSNLENEVLKADLAIADDVLLATRVAEQIARGKSAGFAILESGQYFADLLLNSGNEYLRDRAVDLIEISSQILEELYDSNISKAFQQHTLDRPSIVVAESLGPQQLLAFDRRWLKAIVIEHSGTTSHTLILARSLGIPAVVGVRHACVALASARETVVDAYRGLVLPQISPAVDRYYERELKVFARRQMLSKMNSESEAVTKDAHKLEVAANASLAEEVSLAFQNGADGIGLFRTEMLFLERKQAPSEDDQFAIYSQAARIADGRPLIIRTLDVGGDKTLDYLNLPHDKNPFLGYRGARIYREYRELLQTQLRAILRASVHGNIQIIVPMISSLEEIRAFKAGLAEAQKYLQKEGISFKSDIPFGIMIEIPSIAFVLDQLCPEVDFFSIGTNDLAQYFLAVDRENSHVEGLFDVLHPGFIRMLQQVVEEIHRAGKWVGMCGEMAGEVRYLPLLLGLGLDEISVPARIVHELKSTVRRLSMNDCKQLLKQASTSREISEIRSLVHSAGSQLQNSPLLSEELIVLDSDSNTKEEAIQELVDIFYAAARTHDRRRLEDAVWAREAVYSTGLGFGFATPHCKTDAVNASSIGVLRLKHPVDWGAADHESVRMVILIAMREQNAASGHMQVFSELARKLMNEDFRERLLSLKDPQVVMHYLGQELAF